MHYMKELQCIHALVDESDEVEEKHRKTSATISPPCLPLAPTVFGTRAQELQESPPAPSIFPEHTLDDEFGFLSSSKDD
jgi:hypothetical protein